jgi:broad specificity phosphatase PhoE
VSTLYLIRHGQASFGAADYDVLSPLGIEQSRMLGRHLAKRGQHLDAVYCGPRRRQLDTATHLLDAARAEGVAYPEMAVLDELDEYPALELLRHWLPTLSTEEPELAALLASGDARGPQRLLEVVSQKWARGELDTGELESFVAFSERVGRGLEAIMRAEGRGKRVAVVTSGGPISITMRMCLGLAEDTTLRVAWVIANSSVSEFRYREAELTMVAFNAVPHLEDAHVTYR